ncbi:MAG: glycosyltransferase [Anaerolineales bacterium]|nr:glycosyltransferase [Anaerolineales bacterium]
MRLMVYLPAYNEEKTIRSTLEGILQALQEQKDLVLLVVDDGSTDRTAAEAQSAGAEVVSHHTNLGVGRVFHTAVQEALERGVDVLVSIDADGQFNPEQILSLIIPLEKQSMAMVTGNRFMNGRPASMPLIKYLGNQVVARLVSAMSGTRLRDVSCGFRSYSREALLHLNLFGDFTYTHESILTLANHKLPILETPVDVRYFPDRESRVAKNLTMYSMKISKIIFRVLVDNKALRVFGIFSSFFTTIGLFLIAFLFGHYFLKGSFSPYKSVGFIGLGFIILGLFILLFALIADLINRLRINQERILIMQKKSYYRQKEKDSSQG